MKVRLVRWVAPLLLSTCISAAWAETDAERIDRLEKENAALRERVSSLEAFMNEVRQVLPKAPSTPPATPPAKSVSSKWDAQIYGYVRGDMAYDTQEGFPGNIYLYANPKAGTSGDDQMSFTARQSRLGVNIRGPKVGSGTSRAQVEVDFYGEQVENKNAFMMRHAYASLEWAKQDVSILAGQTWDVVSPLYMPSFNFGVGADVGNPGYRRPQFRVTKGFRFDPQTRLELQAAAARSIGRAVAFAPPSDTGGDAGHPNFQGRAGIQFRGLGGRPTSVGVSGLWGREEFHPTRTAPRVYIDTWMANLDWTIPVADWLTVNGEAWVGSNLHSYYGGIGQGTNTDRYVGIGAAGGWINAALGPFGRSRINVGYGLDDPTNGDIMANGRTRNCVTFGNYTYELGAGITTGAELSLWETRFQGLPDAHNFRAQLMMMYGF